MSLQAIPSDTFYKGKGKKRTNVVLDQDVEKPDIEEQQMPKRSHSLDRQLSMPLKSVEIPKTPGEASPEFKKTW